MRGSGQTQWQFAAAPDSLLFLQAHVSCGGRVLIIGDSHILICGAHQAFPGCDVYARNGRHSTEGLEVLDLTLRPRHEVVVFDLSTNDTLDPPALGRNLDLLWQRIGGRELVLVNTWRGGPGRDHRAVNAILRRFAQAHPRRARLVDWAAYIDDHPAPLGPDPDYVHFDTEVYRDRIALLSRAIDDARERAARNDRTGGTAAD